MELWFKFQLSSLLETRLNEVLSKRLNQTDKQRAYQVNRKFIKIFTVFWGSEAPIPNVVARSGTYHRIVHTMIYQKLFCYFKYLTYTGHGACLNINFV